MSDQENEKKQPGKIRRIWSKLNGKKTLSGIVLHSVWFGVHMLAGIDKDVAWKGHVLIGPITGTGGAHKVAKSRRVNKLLQGAMRFLKK